MSNENGDTKALVRQHLSLSQEILAELQTIEIETQDDYDLVRGTMTEARSRRAVLDDARKKLVAPIDAARAAVQDLFAPPIKQWRDVEAACKERIAEHAQRQAAADARAAQELAARVQEAGGVDRAVEVADVLEAAPDPVVTSGVTLATRWEAEVTDLRALVQAVASGGVPLELLRPDDSALRIYARAHRDSAPVPGVRIYSVQEVRAR
jgi:hypothetical protein